MAFEAKPPNEYTVGWVCALPKEQTAATAMLDQRHADLPKPSKDPNTYTLGSICNHNVVIACLPKGHIGNNPAATVTAWMISTFPSIKFGLMVGIGGGIPPKVRLGDVMVSTPVGQFPGVVQWDFGKAEQGESFERTGVLNNPPTALLTALTRLETEHELNGSRIPDYLDDLKQKYPRLAPKYLRSDALEDVLFKANYTHVHENTDSGAPPDGDDEEEEKSCEYCDGTQVVKKKPRDMRVHYGLIASGNQVIKDAISRDKLKKSLGGQVLCIEMEAAGLMNNFPCIIIRGICDYADSHKNKDWQEHAAAVAAAFAKELLGYIQPSDVDGERTVKNILNQVQDTVSTVTESIAQLGSMVNTEKDKKILDWLTPVDYGSQQSDYLNRRQPGTCQWFLDSGEYKTWLTTSTQTLFCPGIPGAGKTILASIIIANLEEQFQEDTTVGISYLYCNFRQSGNQKAEDLLLSLLKQLCYPSPPKFVKDLYEHHERTRTRPTLDEISGALQSVTMTYSRVFIVVDALDECQTSDGHRTKFLSQISNLQAKTGANLLATSRHLPEIEKEFEGSIELEIHASDGDVRKYIEEHMFKLPRFVERSPELQEDIKIGIVQSVKGMFLLAQLHLDSLVRKRSPQAVRDALGKLPTGSGAYDDAYKGAMERIQGLVKDQQELAIQTFSWITCAKRPLTTFELRHALAVEENTSKFSEDNVSDIEDIISACAGLVTVDEETGIIRLVHYTTQEYFERNQNEWLPDAETYITKVCVTYLSFSVFGAEVCETEAEVEKRLRFYCLYSYAAHNWGHHARNASAHVKQLILDLLESEPKLGAFNQVIKGSVDRFDSILQIWPARLAGMHLAAYFGLQDVTAELIKNGHDSNAKDSDGKTPLSWAALRGHEAIVQLLLSDGNIDVNSEDYRGQTPLTSATMRGHKAIVQLLLDHDSIDPDAKDEMQRTPLWWAALWGHEAIVKLLLAHNSINVNSEDSDRQTPLSWAAKNGHEAVVQLLLSHDNININAKDNMGRTPLSRAARNGHETIVRLLLTYDSIDIDSRDEEGQTPLLWAAENGHSAVVQQLFEKMASPQP